MEAAALLASLIILIAAPALIYRNGLPFFFGMLAFAAALVAVVFASPDAFAVVLQPCVIGLVAGLTIRQKKSFQFYILASTITMTVLLTGQFLFLKHFMNTDLAVLIKERLLELMQYPIPEESKTLFIGQIDQAIVLFSRLFPFYYFLNSLIWSSIAWPVMKYLVKAFRGKGNAESDPGVDGIEKFRMSDYTVFVLIVSLALVAFFKDSPDGLLFLAGLNITLLCMMLYFVQALGIVRFFIVQKKIPYILLPVTIVVVLVIGWPANLLPLMLFFSTWGLVDLWTDFRKINPTTSSREKGE